jgi:DNA uptake protein ComE-like DNA-binding protein
LRTSRDKRRIEEVQSTLRWKFIPAVIVALSVAAGLPIASRGAQTAAPRSSTKSTPIPPPQARTDLNHASLDELLKVPGMTPSWAGRIVRFRPYRNKQDLFDHGVLPSDVYDRIKDYVIAHRGEQ